jgi:hypothetical protein
MLLFRRIVNFVVEIKIIFVTVTRDCDHDHDRGVQLMVLIDDWWMSTLLKNKGDDQ